jgi:transposase
MKTIVGIDWSEKKHDVRIHNQRGGLLEQFAIEAAMEGFAYLARRIKRYTKQAEETVVGIETSHNLLVDFLVEQGYQVYILAPSVVHANRGRHRASQAKGDDADAFLLADILRTDINRLQAWKPNSEQVQQMTCLLGRIEDVTKMMTQELNRLRGGLLRYYPQALNGIKTLKTQSSLTFLTHYPDPTEAKGLSYAQWQAFCQAHTHWPKQSQIELYNALQQPAPLPPAGVVPAYRRQTVSVARHLQLLLEDKKQLIDEVNRLFEAHEDAYIFDSLPGAGDLLAPSLLVLFGDWRDRYPDPAMLQAIAGTAPVTVSSGKSRQVRFRLACNHAYRNTLQQFAKQSTTQSPWALTYFQTALARTKSNNQAYRSLANRWVKIIWTLWQRGEAYNEDFHLQQIQRHRRW